MDRSKVDHSRRSANVYESSFQISKIKNQCDVILEWDSHVVVICSPPRKMDVGALCHRLAGFSWRPSHCIHDLGWRCSTDFVRITVDRLLGKGYPILEYKKQSHPSTACCSESDRCELGVCHAKVGRHQTNKVDPVHRCSLLYQRRIPIRSVTCHQSPTKTSTWIYSQQVCHCHYLRLSCTGKLRLSCTVNSEVAIYLPFRRLYPRCRKVRVHVVDWYRVYTNVFILLFKKKHSYLYLVHQSFSPSASISS